MKGLVADSGPLIIFARSGQLDLLIKIAGSLHAPQVVFTECTTKPLYPGADVLLHARTAEQLTLHPDPAIPPQIPSSLDPGEQASLALALQLQCPLLIDELSGRRTAKILGVAHMGSLAVLLKAKRRGQLEKVSPVLAAFAKNGYFIGKKLKSEILKKAGE